MIILLYKLIYRDVMLHRIWNAIVLDGMQLIQLPHLRTWENIYSAKGDFPFMILQSQSQSKFILVPLLDVHYYKVMLTTMLWWKTTSSSKINIGGKFSSKYDGRDEEKKTFCPLLVRQNWCVSLSLSFIMLLVHFNKF